MSDAEREIRIEAPPSRILPDPLEGSHDGATLYGLGIGLALLIVAMLLGGSLAAYVDLPAFMMVIGGTAAVTAVSFSLDDLRRLPSALATAVARRVPAAHHAAARLVALAETARRHGFMALEDLLPRLKDDRFLIKAVALVVDNTEPDEIERQLRTELSAMLARHRVAADMLRRAGEVAPAMGLIGTLVGLVQMLSNLNNPTTIGPAMAVAILATLYGAVLANMVLLPLAAKLERNNHAEALVHNLTILAANSIARRENPRRLEVVLNGILPPAERISYFD
nr:MotA/TolQ/ExbB proton channel family protein [Aliidongia dinghuensis]